MRRHERDRHCVEPPDEDRPAVREVVRGRPRGRRADQPVAGNRPEFLAADRPAELDHPPERRARHDHVVDRRPRSAAGLRLQHGQLDNRVVAGKRAPEPLLERVGVHRGQEAHAPEVDPDHGHAHPEEALQRPQHRPVPAKHDGQVGSLKVAVVAPEIVLVELLVRKQQLDSPLVGEPAEPLERRADRLRPAVGDHGGALHVSGLNLRSSSRAHREAPGARG